MVEHVFSSLVNPKPSSLGVAFALTFLHIERACACYYYSLIIGLKPKEWKPSGHKLCVQPK